MQQPDKLTETRGSLDAQTSLMKRISRLFCPCISFTKHDSRNTTDYFQSNMQNFSNRTSILAGFKELELKRKLTIEYSPDNRFYKTQDIYGVELTHSAVFDKDKIDKIKGRSSLQVGDQSIDYNRMNFMLNAKKKQIPNFPIFKYKQNQLIMIGKNKKHMLVLIENVKLEPSPLAVQKQFFSKSNNQKTCKQTQSICKVLDEFWKIRYYYFEKFDEGIKIDEESLKYLTPEIVSDYISGKCHQCKVAVDAFSGVGHNATKLGTVCEKVICVQQDANKYNYLINNAKCYEIYNIELFMKPFLEINLKTKIDVVLLHPYILNEVYLQSNVCEMKYFRPNLAKVIKKSLEISNNIVLLLPKNISIKDICYEVSKQAEQTEKIFCSCSLKIQKIYFKGHLMYIAMFFGPSVQTQIKINAELQFIYKILKDSQEKTFQYKKLIKNLRQKYGMIKLLNFVSQSLALESSGKNAIYKFVQIIRQKKLIPEQKLMNLLIDDKNSPHKQISKSTNSDFQHSYQSYSLNHGLRQNQEEQKIQQTNEEQRQSITERTQSFYSHVSGFSGLNKKNTLTLTESGKRTIKHSNSDAFEVNSNTSSIIIKEIRQDSLQKQSKSPASPVSKNIANQRHTLNHKQIQNLIKQNDKKRLKMTLIARPEEDDLE